MEVIGLTGGIGTGKSTASEYLAEKGFAIVDADKIAREVVEPGEPLLTKLEMAFGSKILTDAGSLDRKALAAIVFEDAQKRKELDRLMHGQIIRIIDERVKHFQREPHKGIIIDAPLLFEAGLDKKCGRTWLLVADEPVRIQRVCARDNAKPEEVTARIKSQMSDTDKKKRATLVIDNSGSRQELFSKLDRAIGML